jgi:hypothetical protein
MRIISIHQPNYIPWLGYFYKISQSDCFVFLDDAQFSNEGMHNFHYIKTSQGRSRLKIPVQQTLGDRIMDVRTKDELNWKTKHLGLIAANYNKARFFTEVYSDFSHILLQNYSSLSGMNASIIRLFCEKLGIKVEFITSSDLKIFTTREEKILNLCTALYADVYCSGTGAQTYQKEENFTKRGIQLRYLEFTPFTYEQQWGGFCSNVSILDYLFNCGYDWEYVLRQQNGKEN